MEIRCIILLSMKRSKILLALAGSALFASCVGPAEPSAASGVYAVPRSDGLPIVNPYYGYSSSITPMEVDREYRLSADDRR